LLNGLPFEALTTPALLSQRERREKDVDRRFFFFPLSPSGREGSGE
jgi:hypothetical protein